MHCNYSILFILAGLYTADIVNYRKRCKTAKIKEYKVMKLQVQIIYSWPIALVKFYGMYFLYCLIIIIIASQFSI